MEYINLEDDQPKAAGIYKVKVNTSAGERDCKAEWFPGTGFVPIDCEMEPEDYIYAWME